MEAQPIVGQRLRATVQIRQYEPATVEVFASVPVAGASDAELERAYQIVHDFTQRKLRERFTELYSKKEG